ncbi:MAG: squalene/phytoene synthase family protein [Acidobacteriota bacterium]
MDGLRGRGADLFDLLKKTSRTFALSIPPLPEPTRREVTVAYLLFRIADTFEDAAHHPPEARVGALRDFVGLVREPSPVNAARLSGEWGAARWAAHPGYQELISEIPFVMDAFRSLSPGAVEAIRGPVVQSADGMASFVVRTREGRLALSSLDDLKAYCYVVAGLVGEMLTELFLLCRPQLAAVGPDLRRGACAFGEALQLVNILKDAMGDAAEGRSYLPPDVPLEDVFALARRDLVAAGEYIESLERGRAPRGILEFTALPVELAWATLDRIEQKGSGAKVSRPEVFSLVRRVRKALDAGDSVASHRCRP